MAPLSSDRKSADKPDLIVRSNKDGFDGDQPERRLPPTLEAGAESQYAYSYFNDALFRGELPDCQITYTRQANVLGHFYPDRYERSDGSICHEIAQNPHYLALRDDRESLSTLVHEMAHLWRHVFGPLNKRGGRGANGYHDLVWVGEMERIGLMPSDTGLPGGKKTGNRMSHYIIPGGPFDRACRELLGSGFRINWHDRIDLTGSHPRGRDDGDEGSQPELIKKDRIKITCPACGLNAWAKPSARLICGACTVQMRPAGANALPARKPVSGGNQNG